LSETLASLEPQGQLARGTVVQQLQVFGLVLAVEEEVEQTGESSAISRALSEDRSTGSLCLPKS
jgi:hypothetical protein